jgi:hypothetical protein
MKNVIYIILFLSSVTACFGQTPIQVASRRYSVLFQGEKFLFPYESSHDVSTRNDAIKRVIFAIHSSGYDARQYYSNAAAMLDKVSREKEHTLVIAPHFLDTNHMQGITGPDFLHWTVRPFWGSSRGFYNNREVSISAFDVIDCMLSDLITSQHFPGLRDIVVMGHSAGGQMVNRYAACNLFESRVAAQKNIAVKYVVMAPSSYVYFSGERPVAGSTTTFAVPDRPDDGYDRWGYGLGSLYAYHRRNHITADRITQQYPQKTILYLVGSKDSNGNDTSLDKGPAALLQGANRLMRARLYYNYLRNLYGDEMDNRQYFRVVNRVGHWGKGLMTSPACVKFVFEYSLNENR